MCVCLCVYVEGGGRTVDSARKQFPHVLTGLPGENEKLAAWSVRKMQFSSSGLRLNSPKALRHMAELCATNSSM